MKPVILLGTKKDDEAGGKGIKRFDKSKRINFAFKIEDYIRRFQDYKKIHHYGK